MALTSEAERKHFTSWLNTKLQELNIDESVFGSYIIGILDGDENEEEKVEAITAILCEINENNLPAVITEILSRWNECSQKKSATKTNVDVDEQLARLLESQKLQITTVREYTEEELKIRKQILEQYSQTEVSEEEDCSGDDTNHTNSSAGIVRNTNAQEVAQLQKDRREKLKLESQQKKEKDKSDREKQKAMREEKKEKRKTVKGERRR